MCCDVPYDGFARYPFCDRCFSGRCRRCASRVRESILSPFHLIGRPRGPQMACGWGCGACLTEHQMRTHLRSARKGPRARTMCAEPRRIGLRAVGRRTRDCGAQKQSADVRRGGECPAAGSAEPSLRPARFAGISPSAGGDHRFELGHTNACRTLQSSWSLATPQEVLGTEAWPVLRRPSRCPIRGAPSLYEVGKRVLGRPPEYLLDN